MNIITAKTFEEARKNIKGAKEKPLVFSGGDDELNRKVLEKERVDIFLPALANRKDFSKQRNSGFNQVLADIAKKKEVIIGIDVDELKSAQLKEQSRLLSRVKQNIVLCTKKRLRMVFVSCKPYAKQDLQALGAALGMPSWMPCFY